MIGYISIAGVIIFLIALIVIAKVSDGEDMDAREDENGES